MPASNWPLSSSDLDAARHRVGGRAHRTPLLHSRLLDKRVGRRVLLKAENLQRSGSFKFRGAVNALLAALEGGDRGPVGAVSSGNHGQALALAASELGLAATVVMPEDSSAVKVAAVGAYGARVITEGVTASNREELALELCSREGLRLVHPHNDPLVMAGQSTLAAELQEQLSELGAEPGGVLAPLGGGGLLAGLCLGAAPHLPGVAILGVEPESGDDGARSLREGRLVTLGAPPETAADGVRTLHLGSLCWEVIRERAGGVLTVSEKGLAEACWWLLTRTKLMIEPTAGLPLAALLEHPDAVPPDGDLVLLVSGGNCLPEQLVAFISRYAAERL